MRTVNDYTENRDQAPDTDHQLVGLEIEVEGVPRDFAFDLGRHWGLKPDGSLRDNGMEFVSRPLPVDTAFGALRTFYRWDRENHFRHTVRTSTHVHVDMRYRTLAEVVNIVAAYTLVEPLLMAACGPVREENIYCVPFYRANDDLEHIYSALVKRPGLGTLRNTCKYSALYLEPLVRFGTMEFRQAPVWDTVDQSVWWLRALIQLTTNSFRVPVSESVRMYNEMGPADYCRRMLGNTYDWLVFTACAPNILDVEALLESHEVLRQATMLMGSPCKAKHVAKGWQTPNARGPVRPLAPRGGAVMPTILRTDPDDVLFDEPDTDERDEDDDHDDEVPDPEPRPTRRVNVEEMFPGNYTANQVMFRWDATTHTAVRVDQPTTLTRRTTR